MSGLVRSAGRPRPPSPWRCRRRAAPPAASTQAATTSGSTKGMSPCRLITTSWRRRGPAAASAATIRSEPEGRSGSVSTARPPAARTASTISASPAATATGPTPAASACAQHAHDHRHAADVGQRLAGQAGRGHARGDEDDRVHLAARAPRWAVARAPVACKRAGRNKGRDSRAFADAPATVRHGRADFGRR